MKFRFISIKARAGWLTPGANDAGRGGYLGTVNPDALTEREIDILTRVAQGNSNKIVASQLDISEATVKYHLKSILSKLGANDRTHAVTIARKRGFIEG